MTDSYTTNEPLTPELLSRYGVRPLRPPKRPRCPDAEQLRQLATDNPPPPEWFDGEQEKPFK